MASRASCMTRPSTAPPPLVLCRHRGQGRGARAVYRHAGGPRRHGRRHDSMRSARRTWMRGRRLADGRRKPRSACPANGWTATARAAPLPGHGAHNHTRILPPGLYEAFQGRHRRNSHVRGFRGALPHAEGCRGNAGRYLLAPPLWRRDIEGRSHALASHPHPRRVNVLNTPHTTIAGALLALLLAAHAVQGGTLRPLRGRAYRRLHDASRRGAARRAQLHQGRRPHHGAPLPQAWGGDARVGRIRCAWETPPRSVRGSNRLTAPSRRAMRTRGASPTSSRPLRMAVFSRRASARGGGARLSRPGLRPGRLAATPGYA